MGQVTAASAASVGISLGLSIISRMIPHHNKVTREGSRLSEAQITSSAEGAPIKRLWGRCRLSGCVIWSTNFKEKSTTTKTTEGHGKGGGNSTQVTTITYTYSVSFAVAFCEGRSRVSLGRVWADGKLMDLSKITYRFYPGNDTQLPDHIIEVTEGFGKVPAFRGVTYMVFENLELADYGNRIPSITAEIIKPVFSENVTAVENLTHDVGLFPLATQFNLGNQIYLADNGIGTTTTENTTNSKGVPNLQFTLEEIKNTFSSLDSITIPISWFYDPSFGNIKPRIMDNSIPEVPIDWRSSTATRENATLDTLGYGSGTQSDACIREAIQYAKSLGLKVNIQLHLLNAHGINPPEDINMGNNTINDFSPWDGEKVPFYGSSWNYSHFMFHYAMLVSDLSVDSFIIGTDLKNVTHGYYGPAFINGLVSACAQIKNTTNALVSYCASYNEYGANFTGFGGNSQVSWPLDELWNACDFVCIHALYPLSDWRDGTNHLDYGIAKGNPYNQDYLKSNIEGGEYYDWVYLNNDARDNQVRTTITDSLHNKPWIYRYKDIRNWAMNPHFYRDSNGNETTQSPWIPNSKPIKLVIGGCCIDKGANNPYSLFYYENTTFPYYSNRKRDDMAQRSVIEAHLNYWKDENLSDIPYSKIASIGWDIRPYPEFPLSRKWSDYTNWDTGHWQNGRIGSIALQSVILDMCKEVGLSENDIDVSGLQNANSIVRGFICEDLKSPRDMLNDLCKIYNIFVCESDGKIKFTLKEKAEELSIDVLESIQSDADYSITRSKDTDLPKSIKLTYYNEALDYQVGAADSVKIDGNSSTVSTVALPCVLSPSYVKGLGDQLIQEAWEQREQIQIEIPKSKIALDVGDIINVNVWGVERKMQIAQNDIGESMALQAYGYDSTIYEATDNSNLDASISDSPVFGSPVVFFMDLPLVTGEEEAPASPRVAAFASPWPGAINIYEVMSNGSYVLRTQITDKSNLGTLVLPPDFTQDTFYTKSQWNGMTALYKPYNQEDSIQSASKEAVLNGANLMAINNNGYWHVIQFLDVTATSNGYAMYGGISGQLGTNPKIPRDQLFNKEYPAIVLYPNISTSILDPTITANDIGKTRTYRYGPANIDPSDSRYKEISYKIGGAGYRPYSPCQVNVYFIYRSPLDPTWRTKISWKRRTRFNGDGWGPGDVPINESIERYLVTVTFANGLNHVKETYIVNNDTKIEITVNGNTPDVYWEVQQFSAEYGWGPVGAPEYGALFPPAPQSPGF